MTAWLMGQGGWGRFHDWCTLHHCKSVHILLDRGEHPDQPMATWRRAHTSLTAVLAESQLIAAELHTASFPVVRIKVEAGMLNQDVPRSDAAASGHAARRAGPPTNRPRSGWRVRPWRHRCGGVGIEHSSDSAFSFPGLHSRNAAGGQTFLDHTKPETAWRARQCTYISMGRPAEGSVRRSSDTWQGGYAHRRIKKGCTRLVSRIDSTGSISRMSSMPAPR